MGFAGGGGTWREAELEGSALDSEQAVLGPLPLSSFVAPPRPAFSPSLSCRAPIHPSEPLQMLFPQHEALFPMMHTRSILWHAPVAPTHPLSCFLHISVPSTTTEGAPHRTCAG